MTINPVARSGDSTDAASAPILFAWNGIHLPGAAANAPLVDHSATRMNALLIRNTVVDSRVVGRLRRTSSTIASRTPAPAEVSEGPIGMPGTSRASTRSIDRPIVFRPQAISAPRQLYWLLCDLYDGTVFMSSRADRRTRGPPASTSACRARPACRPPPRPPGASPRRPADATPRVQ